ncbi:MAG: hypothetical protein H6606_03985 [Flavobacteriales bacterium]|nr:hypothetical protein [Flavobacteriales bacterium]
MPLLSRFSLRFIASPTIIWLTVLCNISFSWAQDIGEEASGKVIELIRADYTEYDQAFLDAERVIGNVRFKHGTATMDCDSAWFYRGENRIEAYGNIYIQQQDTLNLWGDYLEYDGDNRKARVTRNVRLKDQQMSLETQVLEYDLNNKVAHYPNWGKIRNGQDRLRSRKGTYYSRSRTFYFKDSVYLVNPEYTMRSDTLQYNTFTETAYFFGPTYIHSKENVIFCRYGWYDTRRNMAEFSKGAWIDGKQNRLVADSLLYNRNTGVGQAFRNIVLTDTLEDFRVHGAYGRYHEQEKRIWITGEPIAVKYSDGDSLFLRADTLLDLTDSSGFRALQAFPNTKLYRSDLQGVCDSLSYGFTDSTIRMFGKPILWSGSDQITGDTIHILRRNGQLDRMLIRSRSFITSLEKERFFNQIGGRNMVARFKEGKLDQVDVYGNGRSLYYAREADSTYTGANYIECSEMRISLDSNKVQEISFYNEPNGTFYPVNEVPSDKQRIQGFVWSIERKPFLDQFVQVSTSSANVSGDKDAPEEELPVLPLPER